MRRRRHNNANYYLVCARALLAALQRPTCTALTLIQVLSLTFNSLSQALQQRVALLQDLNSQPGDMRTRPGLQALRSASQAVPDVPVLLLEDDVRIASSFALRLSSWISAIEARRGPSAAP